MRLGARTNASASQRVIGRSKAATSKLLPAGAMELATEAVRKADVFIVAGTSAQVYPAAGLIPLAIANRVVVIEINPEDTDYSDEVTYALRGPSAELLPKLFT